MPQSHAVIPARPQELSILHGGAIEPMTEYGLRAIVHTGTAPTESDWLAASTVGTMVVRSLAEGDTPAWLPTARGQWDARSAALTSEAERRGVRLVLWPHAEDVVSDIPGLVTFCRAASNPRMGAESGSAATAPWALLLDPAALMTPAMLSNADDHLARLRDTLELDFVRTCVAGIVLRARLPNGTFAELSSGSDVTRALVRAWRTMALSCPVVLTGDDAPTQQSLLLG